MSDLSKAATYELRSAGALGSALRAAANAGPDDVVCMMPDGSLGAAVSEDGWVYVPNDDGDRWDHRFHYEDDAPEAPESQATASLYRIVGVQP